MTPQLRSLLWKEWEERKVQLALCTGWMLLGTGFSVLHEFGVRFRAEVADFHQTCFFYTCFVVIFLATKTALGEETQGTFGFSSALPLSLRMMGLVRLGGAIVTLVAPIALMAVLLSTLLGCGILEQTVPRPIRSGWMPLEQKESLSAIQAAGLTWKVAAVAGFGGIELLLIICLIGTRQRSEVNTAYLGAAVAFLWTGFSFPPRGSYWSYDILFPQSMVFTGNNISIADWAWIKLFANAILLVGLSAWFARCYGKHQRRSADQAVEKISGLDASLLSRLPIRLPGRLGALVWLDLRQSVPLAAAGSIFAAVLAIGMMAWNRVTDESNFMVLPFWAAFETVNFWIAALWAAAVGAGLFFAELQPRLGHFWRSRPIDSRRWFRVKFCIGLLAVIGVLDAVPLIFGWGRGGGEFTMSRAYIACMPFIHALLYAAAVCGVAWLRRPVVAAIAAVWGVLALLLLMGTIPAWHEYHPFVIFRNLLRLERFRGIFDVTMFHYPQVYCSMAALIAVIAYLAYRGASRAEGWFANRGLG